MISGLRSMSERDGSNWRFPIKTLTIAQTTANRNICLTENPGDCDSMIGVSGGLAAFQKHC